MYGEIIAVGDYFSWQKNIFLPLEQIQRNNTYSDIIIPLTIFIEKDRKNIRLRWIVLP